MIMRDAARGSVKGSLDARKGTRDGISLHGSCSRWMDSERWEADEFEPSFFGVDADAAACES